MCLACLLRRHTTDHVGPIRQSLSGVESTLPTRCISIVKSWERRVNHRVSGQSLAQNSGILADEQVVDSIGVAASGCRLGERPASSFDFLLASDTEPYIIKMHTIAYQRFSSATEHVESKSRWR